MLKKILTAFLPALILAFTVQGGEKIRSVEGLTISIEGDEVILHWNSVIIPGEETLYKVTRSGLDGTCSRLTPLTYHRESRSCQEAVYSVTVHNPASGKFRDEVVIEDFESGTVELTSYPEQDLEPDSWNFNNTVTYQNSNYSLFLYGNTWKMQTIPAIAMTYNSVWGIAVNSYGSGANPGEIEALGISDGVNELFYTFRGSEFVDSVNWIVTYHWYGDEDTWIFHHLPVGRDWISVFGYEPNINTLIYINDEDGLLSNGGIYFDYICDISMDMPQAPVLTVDYELLNNTNTPGMSIGFTATAVDPDPDTLFFHWDFGDGYESDLQNPTHTYIRPGDYTVLATVHDSTMMFDRRTIELALPMGTPYTEITVNFTGDVMMARRYVSGGLIPAYGANIIWEPTLSALGEGADISIVNLECPFTTNTNNPHPTKEYIFHGEPEYLNALVFAGIEGVTLANNHTTDYMEPGFIDTRNTLDTLGIKRFGAGLNEYEAMQPAVFFAGGVSVGMLGYCNRTGRIDNLPPFLEAGPNKAGFTWFKEYYIERTIPQAAQLYDIVVANVHCGTEYSTRPDTTMGGDALPPPEMPFPPPIDSTTLLLQYQALDLGADLVVSHHPHVLQGYHVYNGKLIAHSMGNFAFDQYYFETFASMILYTEMNRERIFKAYFKPVYIDDYIPRIAKGELARNIIDRIADYSQKLNTTVIPDYETCRGLIALGEHQIVSRTASGSVKAGVRRENEILVTHPVEIWGNGFLSSIELVTGSPGPFEVQCGREMLWVGNFEDEGSTIWDLKSENEIIDSIITLQGSGALRLATHALQGGPTVAGLEKRMRWNWGEEHSICGWMKGINAGGAYPEVIYYRGRTGGASQYTQSIGDPMWGTFNWTYFCEDLNIEDEGYYGDVTFVNGIPYDDEGYAWFDEVKIIRWEDEWRAVPTDIPAPNNIHFIRIRCLNSRANDSLKVHYTEIEYDKF